MSIYEKGVKFNNSKLGIILGYLLASILLAIGIWSLVRAIGMKKMLAIIGSMLIIAISIAAFITETNRATKLRLKH